MAQNQEVNNVFYGTLGEAWYVGQDHPVAMLRAEAKLKNPWVAETIKKYAGPEASVLDVGCGGGFLTNDLARAGFRVSGMDLSEGCLETAARMDLTKSVRYFTGNANAIPAVDGAYDVACCMDVLEHVSDPKRVITECCRVTKSGGIFLFHTFNRTFLSNLIIIHAVNFFFKNVPKDMHLHSYFITPGELESYCASASAQVVEWKGIKPVLDARRALKILINRTVPENFEFKFTKSLSLGYLGVALKR